MLILYALFTISAVKLFVVCKFSLCVTLWCFCGLMLSFSGFLWSMRCFWYLSCMCSVVTNVHFYARTFDPFRPLKSCIFNLSVLLLDKLFVCVSFLCGDSCMMIGVCKFMLKFNRNFLNSVRDIDIIVYFLVFYLSLISAVKFMIKFNHLFIKSVRGISLYAYSLCSISYICCKIICV